MEFKAILSGFAFGGQDGGVGFTHPDAAIAGFAGRLIDDLSVDNPETQARILIDFFAVQSMILDSNEIFLSTGALSAEALRLLSAKAGRKRLIYLHAAYADWSADEERDSVAMADFGPDGFLALSCGLSHALDVFANSLPNWINLHIREPGDVKLLQTCLRANHAELTVCLTCPEPLRRDVADSIEHLRGSHHFDSDVLSIPGGADEEALHVWLLEDFRAKPAAAAATPRPARPNLSFVARPRWRREQDPLPAPTVKLHPGHSYAIPPITTVNPGLMPDDYHNFLDQSEDVAYDSLVLRLRNVTFLARSGLFLLEDGTFFGDSHGYDFALTNDQRMQNLHADEQGRFTVEHLVGDRKIDRVVNDPVYWLCYMPHGYNHFLVEFAPRLSLRSDFSDLRVVIPGTGHGYIDEILNLCGIPREQRIEILRPRDTIFFKELYLPFVSAYEGWGLIHDKVIEFYDEMKRRLYQQNWDNPFGTRLFVTRKDETRYRNMLNEAQWADQLRDAGFREVQASKLSIQDKINLFSRAQLVAGPVGAGLANMVFGESLDCLAVSGSLYPPQQYRGYLADFCRNSVRSVQLVIGPSIASRNKRSPQSNVVHSNYLVDLDDTRRATEALLDRAA